MTSHSTEAAGPPFRCTLRVLVIDDEPMVGELVKQMLSNHIVEVFLRAQVALKCAQETPFDLVICDLHMPEMSGIELHHALLNESGHLTSHFVLMTGAAMEPDIIDFLARWSIPLLRKPFRLFELRQLLSAVFGRDV